MSDYPKKPRPVALFFLVVTLAFIARSAAADEQVRKSNAEKVVVLNQSATMYESRDYLVTQVTGPVGKEGIPSVFRLGDVARVDGKSIKVNYIFVTEYLTEMRWGKVILARPGDIKYLTVEAENDVPNGEKRNRRWINVDQCHPIIDAESSPAASSASLQIMTPSDWRILARISKTCT